MNIIYKQIAAGVITLTLGAGVMLGIEKTVALGADILTEQQSLEYIAEINETPINKNFVLVGDVIMPKSIVVQERISPNVASSFLSAERAIYADLNEKKLTLYEGGDVKKVYDILSIGKAGSPWETPTGAYTIQTKEENHFSSIGEVWMPYSMQFFGNFFIHGWPYYADGSPVPQGYSGGCIRLGASDASEVFSFAERGTAVIVDSLVEQKMKEEYTIDARALEDFEISATAYIVADVATGDILLGENVSTQMPIASITKLMSALVSLEAVNQFQKANVSARALETYGDSGGLKLGEQIITGDLIYPVLLSSSNDAAEVLAEHIGRSRFINFMNQKAVAIGLKETVFEDPSGISSKNISTPKDLFIFSQYLYKDKKFVLDITKRASEKRWVNNNEFINYDSFIGGKTGHTTLAKDTFLGVFSLKFSEFESRPVTIILLGSSDRQKDAETLLQFMDKNIFYGPKVEDMFVRHFKPIGGVE